MILKLQYHFLFPVVFYILSNFEQYTCQELSNVILTLNVSQINQGFHRLLCYDANIQNVVGNRKILVKENLIKDMYVDPYEVFEDKRVSIKGPVDCEIPAYLADELEVQICSLISSSAFNICIPIHFRYQKPHECGLLSDTVSIFPKYPEFFINKKIQDSSNISPDDCFNEGTKNWIHVPKPEINLPVFQIPVGCTEHFYWVVLLTILVVSLSAIYLSYNLIKS